MRHEKPDYVLPVKRFEQFSASYSGDRIEAGKIRRPFSFEGALWVSGGGWLGVNFHACRIVPIEAFDGKPTTYSEKVHNNQSDTLDELGMGGGDTARNDPMGFYHGMTVKQGGKTFVLVGPEKLFAAQTEAQTEAEAPEMPTLAPIVGEQISMFGA